MQLTKTNIRDLKNYFSKKPILRAYLFGSYARKEAHSNSDIDILVELDYSEPIGFKFYNIREELKNLLGKKVDLVSEAGLSDFVRPFVEKDRVLIYER